MANHKAKRDEVKDVIGSVEEVAAMDVIGSVEEVAAMDTPVEPVAVKEKKVSVPVEIVRGRMPVVVVYDLRFNPKNVDLSVGQLAVKYGTTVGKVVDVQKSYNFAYVLKEFAPTKAQKEEGITWLQRHPKFAEGVVAELMDDINEYVEATQAQADAFLLARVAARGQLTTTKDGGVANGGGGNRRVTEPKAKKVETSGPVDIDVETDLSEGDLLA
jgi:hypothetical protein